MEKTQREANLRALVGMLDETDPDLYQHIRKALLDIGPECLPYLDEAESLKDDALWKNRIAAIRQELQIETACKELSAWKQEAEPDLLKGFYLLSHAFYPQLLWEETRDWFNRLHGDCWLLLSSASGLKETLARYNNFFFNVCQFTLGHRLTQGYGFSDFFLPSLINLKRGNERALALVYQCLAARNKIPVFILSLPVINFLACSIDLSLPYKENIRFCIDITRKGALVERMDIEPVFSQQKRIRVCSTVEALQDYAELLYMMASTLEQDNLRLKAIEKLHHCLNGSPGQ